MMPAEQNDEWSGSSSLHEPGLLAKIKVTVIEGEGEAVMGELVAAG